VIRVVVAQGAILRNTQIKVQGSIASPSNKQKKNAGYSSPCRLRRHSHA
jgi:hypothetical protein